MADRPGSGRGMGSCEDSHGLDAATPTVGMWTVRMTRLRRGVRRPRTLLATTALFLAAIVGCAGSAVGGMLPPPVEVEPTPWVEGTLRAEIGARLAGAMTPAMATPTARAAVAGPTRRATAARPTAATVIDTASTVAATPPSQATRLEPVAFTAYRLQSDWTLVQGFVQNAGKVPAGDIDVAVLLIADGDAVVGSARAHIKPGMVRVGERAPWLAQVKGAPDFQRVRVQVHAQPLSDFLESTVTQDFQLTGAAVRPPADFSAPTIVGEVVNIGNQPATEIVVTAAIFDGDGALYQVASTVVNAAELPVGERAAFEIRPIGRGLHDITRYELFVEGRPKT
jgi:hypothetical protein